MPISYKIVKNSRENNATPYIGITCYAAGVKPGHIYADKQRAIEDAKKMTSYNGVGFRVVRATKQDIIFARKFAYDDDVSQ